MNLAPVSVLIPTKNEEKNIGRCLEAISGWADEIVVIDSGSTDATVEIVMSYGGKVLQFDYKGGWPKKRQWALDNYQFSNRWILLLDADEILTDNVKVAIQKAIRSDEYDGYWLRFRIFFLGKMLRYGGTELWKLSLFKYGKGKYEKRLKDQDNSMADMEVHEHVVVNGKVGRIVEPVKHENINSLSRYIIKHDQYSNWEAAVRLNPSSGEIKPNLFGSQAARRRWLKDKLLMLPGSPLLFFLYAYIFKLGFLDGKQGFIYAAFRGIYFFQIKAKIFEKKINVQK